MENSEGDMTSMGSLKCRLHWWLVRKLRCPPAEHTYAVTTDSNKSTTGTEVHVRPVSRFTSIDRYVAASNKDPGEYQRMVLRLFLAQRVAFGFAEVIDVVDLAMRVYLIWISSIGFGAVRDGMGNDIMGWGRRLVGLTAVHVWAVLKP